jgi:hypothetical protein
MVMGVETCGDLIEAGGVDVVNRVGKPVMLGVMADRGCIE